MPDLPIRYPRRGLNDNEAYAEQAPDTTRDAQNVRTTEPVEGRDRGGQRSGLKKFASAAVSPGSKVDRVVGAMRDNPRTVYYQLTDDPTDQTGNGLPVGEDEVHVVDSKVQPTRDNTLALATDADGNIFSLSGVSTVVVHNSDLEEITQISLPVKSEDEVVRALLVDYAGSLIAAATDVSTGGQGRVWKFARGEREGAPYQQVWNIQTEGSPKKIALTPDGGTLWVVEDRTSGASEAYASVWTNLDSSFPFQVYERAIPFPVNGIDTGTDGSAYITCQENLRRGEIPGTGGYTTQIVSWVPHELDNGDQRIWAWFDPDEFNVGDGDEITLWPDNKNDQLTKADGTEFDAVLDTTDRLIRRLGETEDYRSGPSWVNEGAGPNNAVRFDGTDIPPTDADGVPGQMLISESNTNATGKADADDSLPDQKAPLPGYTGARYTVCMAVRFDPSDEPQVLCWMKGLHDFSVQGFFSILVNAYTDTGTDAYTDDVDDGRAGHISFRAAPANIGFGLGHGGLPRSGDIVGDMQDERDGTSGGATPDPHVAIITVSIGGDDTRDSCFRVNGIHCDSFGLGSSRMTAHTLGRAKMTFGSPVVGAQRTGDAANHIYETQDYKSFTGDILGYVAVLGDTSSAPHDTNVSRPEDTSGDLPTVPYQWSGSVAQSTAAADATTATEVELVEGWLAHKLGVAHLLPHGYTDSAKGGEAWDSDFWKNHPFGGAGNAPFGEGGTIDSDERDVIAALLSTDPITLKLFPNFGQLAWALSGGGMGYGIGIDRRDGDNHVYTIGPKVEGIGPSGDVEDDVIGRKILDDVTSFDANADRYARARLQNLDPDSTLPPNIGQQVRLGTTTYTVKDPLTGAANEILQGATTQAFLTNLKAAINGEAGEGTLYGTGTVANTLAQVLALDNDWGSGKYTNYGLTIEALTIGPDGNSVTATESLHPFAYLDWFNEKQVYTLTRGALSRGAWVITEANDDAAPTYKHTQLAVDESGRLYVPWRTDVRDEARLKVYEPELGALEWEYQFVTDATTHHGHAIAFPPTRPAEFTKQSIEGPEFAYCGLDKALDAGSPTLWKLRLVAPKEDTSAGWTPRTPVFLGWAGGSLKSFVRDGSPTIVDAADGVDATDLYSTSAPIISTATLFGEVFFTDGIRRHVYSIRDNEVSEFKATSRGEMPPRVKLMTAWGGRLVVSLGEDASNWWMSKVGDPYDWDTSPEVLTPLQAINGNDPRVGKIPDLVRTMIPLDADRLGFGCDKSIYVITGNPAYDGRIDLLTSDTGMSFGAPWCKDPEGRVYFIGSNGGFYVIEPGALPVLASEYTIDRRLRSIDWAARRVEMAWDEEERAVRIMQVPYSVLGTKVKSWVWERKANAWDEDSYFSAGKQATCTAVFDSDDPDDRIVVVGCEDGFVRYWDRTAKDDDGDQIDSYFTVWPLVGGSAAYEAGFRNWRFTLDPSQDGMRYELLRGDTAARLGDPVHAGELAPGLNHPIHKRIRGAYAGVRLRNAVAGRRWAYETGMVGAYPGSRKRVRQ